MHIGLKLINSNPICFYATKKTTDNKSSKMASNKKSDRISGVAKTRGFVPVFSPSIYKDDYEIFKQQQQQQPQTSSQTSMADKNKRSLVEEIDLKRSAMFKSVLAFPFNMKRIRYLTTTPTTAGSSSSRSAIVYWMSREQRVQDNWSLLFAQKLALEKNAELHVCFCLLTNLFDAPFRHYHFMIEGLKQVELELKELSIPFHLFVGEAKEKLPEFVQKVNAAALVCDFSPLRVAKAWYEGLKQTLPAGEVPLIQVDGRNIVPNWLVSNELEKQAYTWRAKIKPMLDEFLTEFPPLIAHEPNKMKKLMENGCWPKPIDWDADVYAKLKCDMTVKKVEWAVPGYKAAIRVLDTFIEKRLREYDEHRNEPNKHVCSDMSPWYHFGHVSVQRCMMEVKKHGVKFPKAVNVYLEQCIVRRELGDNFCNFQPDYDNFNGAEEWAKRTLTEHVKDKRQYIYSYDELDNFRTHDKLWNASQIQLRVDGKMHGFLRMYWAKKILEWTETPEIAVQYAVKLNDRYSLDGRDAPGNL